MRTLLLALGLVLGLPAQSQAPEAQLETVRNYQRVSDLLSSSGLVQPSHVDALAEAGFTTAINLAPMDHGEAALLTRRGLRHVHIPVDWSRPTMDDLRAFFEAMDASDGERTLVYCMANMRASAFVYLYRTLVEGVPEAEARATMREIWDPASERPWRALIREAQRAYRGP